MRGYISCVVACPYEGPIDPRRVRDVAATVEAYSGSFALFDDRTASREPEADRPCFPPQIEPEDAAEIARNGLQVALLRGRRGQRNAVVGQVRRVDILQYPFWVYYYERRKNRLDIKILDAVTGGPPGPKVRTSLLAAILAAHRAARQEV